MMMRTLSKALLLVTISVGVPSLASPASAAVRTAQGRKHHHRHHENRRARHHEREHQEHAPDGERHGEL
jgi:hypothetical protein